MEYKEDTGCTYKTLVYMGGAWVQDGYTEVEWMYGTMGDVQWAIMGMGRGKGDGGGSVI